MCFNFPCWSGGEVGFDLLIVNAIKAVTIRRDLGAG